MPVDDVEDVRDETEPVMSRREIVLEDGRYVLYYEFT